MSRVFRFLTVFLVLGLVAGLLGSAMPATAQESEVFGLPSVLVVIHADGSYDLGLEGMGADVRLPFNFINNVLGFFGTALPKLDPGYIGYAQQYGIQHAQICWDGGTGELGLVINDQPLPSLVVAGNWLTKPVGWAREMGWGFPVLPYEQIESTLGRIKAPLVVQFPVPAGVTTIPITAPCGGRLVPQSSTLYNVDLEIYVTREGAVGTMPHVMPGYEYLVGETSFQTQLPWLGFWLDLLPVGLDELDLSADQNGLSIGLDGVQYALRANPEQWQGLANLAESFSPGAAGVIGQAVSALSWVRGDVKLRLVDEAPLPAEAVTEIAAAEHRAEVAEARAAVAEARLAEAQASLGVALGSAEGRASKAEEELAAAEEALQEARAQVEELILRVGDLESQLGALRPSWSQAVTMTVSAGDTLWTMLQAATGQLFGTVWTFPGSGALLEEVTGASDIKPGDQVEFIFEADQDGNVFFVGQEGIRLMMAGFDPPS